MPDVRSIPITLAFLCIACGTPEHDNHDVAAQVAADRITMAQVDARVRQTDPKIWQSLYEARNRALDFLVDESLLLAEAERQGIGRDSLVLREVVEVLPAIGDSAVADFYAQNQQLMDGQPIEVMAGRIREHLVANDHRRIWNDFLGGLREQSAVEIRLQPPRAILQVDDAEPSKGPADAPIVIVEYSDFECPFCARAQPAVAQVLKEYGDRVKLVFRDFPLPIHDNANMAAQAAACADEQDRYWDYHDVLFINYRALRPEDLPRYASALGLDTAAFEACLGSQRHAGGVETDLASGREHGVTGTPAFFINGRMLSGSKPFSAFQELIEEELDRLDSSLL